MALSPTHDLVDFMRQISTEMAAEYQRIRRRSADDPGTAGDEGEENWAALLRDWLPRDYIVVTKGQILSQDGFTSPQIDVLVLNGSYPPRLVNKKKYLAAGVSAAFECKTTLRASHIATAVKNCVKIKSLYPAREGTPYRELHAPLVYGLLAHSHDWKAPASTPEQNIEETLRKADTTFVGHPRSQLDLICVSDLASWSSGSITFFGPRQTPNWSAMPPIYGPNGSAVTSFLAHAATEQQVGTFTPVGAFVSNLWRKLAWENPALRHLADYYRLVNIAGSARGAMRMWPIEIYSGEVRGRAERGPLSNGVAWDEWSIGFP